jgi:hypothetical protein
LRPVEMRHPISKAMIAGAFAIVTAVAAQSALAQSGLTFRDVRVDVSPLRANAGDPTAAWVEQELPQQLAKAMPGRVSPKGGALVVRIDYLTLGPTKESWAWDHISGVATIGGVDRPVRATTRYQVSAADQAMIEQSNHYRVTQLVQALVFELARDL